MRKPQFLLVGILIFLFVTYYLGSYVGNFYTTLKAAERGDPEAQFNVGKMYDPENRIKRTL